MAKPKYFALAEKFQLVNILYMYVAILLAVTSCDSTRNTEPTKNAIITPLETPESRNEFLEEIYHSDQNIRQELSSLESNATGSSEFWKCVQTTDSTNLLKIDKYLSLFGYPDTATYSKEATNAPWFVIQHCPNLDLRLKYHELLSASLEKGSITEIQYYLYLERNYTIKKGETLGIVSDDNYSFKEKIEILLDSLGYKKDNNL